METKLQALNCTLLQRGVFSSEGNPTPEGNPDPDETIPVSDEDNPVPDAKPKSSNAIGRSCFHIFTTLRLMFFS
jgi:hypothetical protein